MDEQGSQITEYLEETFDRLHALTEQYEPSLEAREVGSVLRIDRGVAFVDGLPGLGAQELVRFPGDRLGLALNLDPDRIGVVLLDRSQEIEAGAAVRRTERVASVPVGEGLLGRVIDPTGRPLDGKGPVRASGHAPVEQVAPAIMDRAPVQTPLQTGIKAIDAFIPIGRGQRELVLGDRQTGKTSIAEDTIINQANYEVYCVYCAIGQRASAVAKVIDGLRERGAMEYSTVVAATGDDPPGLQFVAPYAATSIAEHFMRQGRDALIVYDDLTRHARAYRELSLLLRRPPGREAYPGDIFYIHSRLLERATHLRDDLGGGSLTALPIIETEAENLSAYIPTNLISITDGQVYLSPGLFQKGVLPAVDIGNSVSRVGGKAQLPAYQTVTGDLKLAYAQFEELERFSRYGARLEEEKKKQLEHGRRIRQLLKQPLHELMPPGEQMLILFAATQRLLEDIPPEKVGRMEDVIRRRAKDQLSEILKRIEHGEEFDENIRDRTLDFLRQAIDRAKESER